MRVPSLIAIAAGLAMLLALERRDLKGDVAAALLLAVGLASHSTSFAFAVAAAILVLSRPAPERWRRSWVFALPIIAYATWWVLEFDARPRQSLGSVIAETPGFLGESFAATLRATSGVGTNSSYLGIAIPGPLQVVLGVALFALLGVLLVARVRQRRAISPFAIAIAAALLTFWLSTNFAPGSERSAQTSRYLYPDALLLLLLLCELGRDFELPRRLTPQAAIAIIAVFAVSLAGNFYQLRTQERRLDEASDHLRAALTSVELAGSAVSPDFNLAYLAGLQGLSTGARARVLADYGSPAYSLPELLSRPQPVRVTADYVLLHAAGSELEPRRSLPAAHNPAPRGVAAFGGKWTTASRGCIELRPSNAAVVGVLTLPPGRLALAARAGQPVVVTAGLLAAGADAPVGSLEGGRRAVLELPAVDGVPEPWRVAIQARQRVLACSA